METRPVGNGRNKQNVRWELRSAFSGPVSVADSSREELFAIKKEIKIVFELLLRFTAHSE